MATSAQLRKYDPPDLEATVAIWRVSARDGYPYNATQQGYTPEQHMWYFREVISQTNDLWVAEDGARIVGCLAIHADFVDQLFVAVGDQRRGIRTALLRKAMELSPKELRLRTFKKNAKARAFYEKHGFVAVDLGRSDPPEDEPDVGYRWAP